MIPMMTNREQANIMAAWEVVDATAISEITRDAGDVLHVEFWCSTVGKYVTVTITETTSEIEKVVSRP